MAGSLNALKTAPLPMKATIGMVLAGGVVGLAYAFGGAPAMYIVLVAIAVVSIVVALYVMLLGKLNKGKSKPFLSKLSENSASAPSGVSDVSARARLDDLRRTFDEGIKTFREHGKDLYSMPWYALVGEPGSGKTEAIRHSSVGFPPGLQDQLQGAGGTLNMNWWFTNHAVILDTAGRLMFEDIAPGQSNEWKEFLKLLRQARPNCPMNGMLLVIPADALIRDTQNEIESKAGKIARQLDEIQRSLGVRFPVFVLVTKADLINGFREFFDDMTDPVLASQMIGWSNPDNLDEPFRPELVEQHLEQVRERLLRRRLGLLVDPVHTEDAVHGRRLDQVDALYAFPDSLAKIGPRLRRYLEMIFVQGEWSQKPLFLRGIYFTSSMRDGEALDQELAEALGVGVESLPEGRGWTKDRSYFLKDLFIDKVFRERGLVTRAGNTRQLKRRRRVALLAAGFVFVVGVGALTWFGSRELNRSMRGPKEMWTAIDKAHAELYTEDDRTVWGTRLIYGEPNPNPTEFSYNAYASPKNGPSGDENWTVADLNEQAAKASANAPATPLVFRPIAIALNGGMASPFGKVEETQREIFDDTVLLPAVDLTRRKLRSTDPTEWSADATRAMAELFRIESGAAGEDAPERFSPEPLYTFLLGDSIRDGADSFGGGDNTRNPEQQVTLAYNTAYGDDGAVWESKLLGAGTSDAQQALASGVGSFVEKWADATTDESTDLGKLSLLRDAVARFEQAESNLVRLSTSLGQASTVAGYTAVATDGTENWRDAYTTLTSAKQSVDARLNAVADFVDLDWDKLSDRLRTNATKTANDQYDLLLGAIPDGIEADDGDEESAQAWLVAQRGVLTEGRRDLESSVIARVDEFRTVLERLKARFIDVPGGGTGDRAYVLRYKMFGVASERLASEIPEPGLFTAAAAFDRLRGTTQDAETLIRNHFAYAGETSPPAKSARDGAIGVLQAVARRQNTSISQSVIRELTSSDTSLGELVKAQASGLAPLTPEAIPLTRLSGSTPLDAQYRPDIASSLFDAISGIETVIAGGNTQAAGVLDADTLRRELDSARKRERAYVESYLNYWASEVPGLARIEGASSWQSLSGNLQALPTAGRLNEQLSSLCSQIAQAIDAVPESTIEKYRHAETMRSAARTDVERLRAESFTRSADEMLRAWRTLPQDATQAKRMLLAMGLEDFRSRMLGMSTSASEGVGPGTVYWKELNTEMLRALATDSNLLAREARDALVREACVFPLCLDAVEVGDRALVEKASERLELLRPSSAAPGTVGAGGFTGAGVIGEYLNQIRGTAVLSPQDKEWLDGLERVVRLLGSGGLEWDPVILADNEDGTEPDVAGDMQAVELHINGRAVPLGDSGVLREGIDFTTDTKQWQPISGDRNPPELVFWFAQELQEGDLVAKTTGGSPRLSDGTSGFDVWGGLMALHNPTGPAPTPIRVGDAQGAYKLKLETDARTGYPFYVGVRFNLDKQIEELLPEWPTIRGNGWPGR